MKNYTKKCGYTFSKALENRFFSENYRDLANFRKIQISVFCQNSTRFGVSRAESSIKCGYTYSKALENRFFEKICSILSIFKIDFLAIFLKRLFFS